MSSQIFKNEVPNDKVYKLLDFICSKFNNNYVFNHEAYKKGAFFNLIEPFLEECRQYYHISKRTYLERKITYNSFTTIIRQICKFNKLAYTSQIKYDKTNYDIIYYIALPEKCCETNL
jgi:hypothetical protein